MYISLLTCDLCGHSMADVVYVHAAAHCDKIMQQMVICEARPPIMAPILHGHKGGKERVVSCKLGVSFPFHHAHKMKVVTCTGMQQPSG